MPSSSIGLLSALAASGDVSVEIILQKQAKLQAATIAHAEKGVSDTSGLSSVHIVFC